MINKFNLIKFLSLGYIFCCVNPGYSALPSQNPEYAYNLKAVFLYNFTKYLTWHSIEDENTFNITILGNSQIIEPLEQIAGKKIVAKKTINITKVEGPDQINDCNILFIPESEKSQLNKIIQKVKNKNILIVSEIDGALTNGAMINFLILDKTIKFEINLQAMKKSGFQPSSELLKLATRLIE